MPVGAPIRFGDRLDRQHQFDLHTENCRIGIIGVPDDWTDDLRSISSKTEAISLSAHYQINQCLERVLLSGAFIHQSAAGIGGSTDRIIAGIAYNRTLAREWRAQLAYYHNENITTTGTARSNALYTTLVRDFTILP